jgi:GT2 family glycosyltransferase
MNKTNKDNLPKVVISILNWMNYQDTITCVQGLLQLDYPNYEILIRDNASPNASYTILKKEFPNLKVFLSKENNGYAAGHLENYKEAKKFECDLFWILNSDIQIFPNALTELVNAYQKYGVHIYGSVSLNPEDSTKIDFGGAVYTDNSNKTLTYNEWKGKEYTEFIAKYPETYEVESTEGSSMLIPMEVIEKYDFMKTDFFMYAEETDYCYSMRRKGVKSMIATRSIVKHGNEGSVKGNVSLKAIPAYYRRRNALRFSMKHLGMKRINVLKYSNGILNNFKAIIKGKFSKNKELSYYYALGSLHAFLGIKGKAISPEKLTK